MSFNQLVNFLDPMFETQVKCSCIVDDFHGVENLIANDEQKLARGFMAYRVVKPPVELEFQLCCSIELVSIKIWPQIDSLKSIGFEIFIQCDNVYSEYRKAANHFNLQEYGIQFVNDSINENYDADLNFAVIPFFPSTKNSLRKVKNVKLVIKQTAKCVPVIKRIEIWGLVSKFATKEQKERIHQTIKHAIESNECSKTPDDNANDEIESPSINETTDTLSTIPEAFLDAITFDVMALPMVLPSGKTIDSSTLQKHNEHEEKWGRIPSDPFTGQPFTDTRKPVLDVHLKSQIDSFLLKNSNVPEISSLPRTVGSISKRPFQLLDECSSKDSKLARTDKTPINGISKSNESITSTNKPLVAMPSSSSSSSTLSSHTRHQSLDEAIRGVLTVGKYTASSSGNMNGTDPHKCFQCSQTICKILYTITTCSHSICRTCLVDKNLNTCKCEKVFRNIDVIKRHQREIL